LRSQFRSRPLWGMVGSRLWSAYTENVSFKLQAPVAMGRIYQTDRKTAIRRLATIDRQINKQRLNAHYYARNLKGDSVALCRETPETFFNRLQYPILLPTSHQCEQMAALLRGEQISTARPYKDIATIAVKHYGYTGDCPRAEQIARSVLVIPCNYSL